MNFAADKVRQSVGMKTRKPHPSDASDEERSFAMSYLALVREGSEQRRDGLREVFNAPR